MLSLLDLLSALMLPLRLDRDGGVPTPWLLARLSFGKLWLMIDILSSDVSSFAIGVSLFVEAALTQPPGKLPWLEEFLLDAWDTSVASSRRRRSALAPATINLDSGGGVILSKYSGDNHSPRKASTLRRIRGSPVSLTCLYFGSDVLMVSGSGIADKCGGVPWSTARRCGEPECNGCLTGDEWLVGLLIPWY